MNTELAKKLIMENSNVLYGIFGIVESSGYFPTHSLLNQFLMLGNDPCDQDCSMKSWKPFRLTDDEYSNILSWWLESHPGSQVSDLGVKSWHEWSYEVIELG